MDDSIDIVSVMAANSETGVIHPVREAARVAHDHGSLLHCDATQAIGKIPFSAYKMGADMVTLSSHKTYGPKGCGALVATREARRRIAAILHGGGQEREMRSGTLNVPAIAGFGEACRIAVTDGLVDAPRQRRLRDEVRGCTLRHHSGRYGETAPVRTGFPTRPTSDYAGRWPTR